MHEYGIHSIAAKATASLVASVRAYSMPATKKGGKGVDSRCKLFGDVVGVHDQIYSADIVFAHPWYHAELVIELFVRLFPAEKFADGVMTEQMSAHPTFYVPLDEFEEALAAAFGAHAPPLQLPEVPYFLRGFGVPSV